MALNGRSERHRSALREFLDVDNLRRALWMSAMVTALAYPRITLAGYGLGLNILYALAAFISMTLVCGAVTAWSGMRGLSRLIPDRAVLLKGLATALVLGLTFGVLKGWILDPILEKAMVLNLPAEEVDLHFPADAFGIFALMCWVAGFETLFFEGGTMTLWSRITGSIWIATAVTVLFRLGVVLIQTNRLDLGMWLVPTILAYIGSQIIGCQLLARAGLFAVVVYNLALQVSLLL
jgi:hypothetical protein